MPQGTSSFERLNEEELEAHLGVARYGSFMLTDAVRPSYDLQVVPTQGYRHDAYRDEQSRTNVPVLMAAVSAERVFETFMDLLDPLGGVLDVVLETSHSGEEKGHTDLYREHIDAPVLKSILWDYEDLLVNDGCTGIAVLNPGVPQRFSSTNTSCSSSMVIGSRIRINLRNQQVRCDDNLKFITEAEHATLPVIAMHNSSTS